LGAFNFLKTGLPLAGLIVVASQSGCLSNNSFSSIAEDSSSIIPGTPAALPTPQPTPSSVVCNPFGETGGSANSGLQATLTYIPPNSPENTTSAEIDMLTVASFLSGAPDVVTENTEVFLSQLDVPDQNFTDGFQGANGTSLTDLSGNVLVSFFALHIDSELVLPSGMPAGNYQFAVLSDDGSIVSIGAAGSSVASQQLIDNDGPHSNTLGCATQTVSLSAGQSIPLHVEYFQGPPVRLGLILFWRQISAGQSLSDSLCGVEEGDSYYFTDSSSGPQPTQNYQNLLSRGWQVVPPSAFVLPSGTSNPCAGST
jgi:hypothetical protein